MMNADSQYLIDKFQKGELSNEEWKLLEQFIESGLIDPEEIPGFHQLMKNLMEIESPVPNSNVKHQIANLIEREREQTTVIKSIKKESWIRYVMTAAALMTGLIIGNILPQRSSISKDSLQALKQEIHALREDRILTLLQDDAPTERLKAVSYSEQIDHTDHQVVTALLNTLNADDNINVRLAAIDVLYKYTAEPWVREALVQSISKQESPLVQVALAECMVAIREKSSIQELKKLMQNNVIPDPVKKKIESYIKQI